MIDRYEIVITLEASEGQERVEKIAKSLVSDRGGLVAEVYAVSATPVREHVFSTNDGLDSLRELLP